MKRHTTPMQPSAKPDPRKTPRDDVHLLRELQTLGPRKPPKRVRPPTS